jgi:hypothetical protein
MDCCKLTLEKSGTVVLTRKRLSSKTLGTSILLKSPVVHDAMEPTSKADKVLQIFSNSKTKNLHGSPNNVE